MPHQYTTCHNSRRSCRPSDRQRFGPSRVAAMSIEQLNKAASAAGFAMATPDDELALEAKGDERREPSPTRALVAPPSSAARTPSPETVTAVTTWIRGHLPAFGWRQPA